MSALSAHFDFLCILQRAGGGGSVECVGVRCGEGSGRLERGSGGWRRWTAVPPGMAAALPMALTLNPFLGRGGRRKRLYWPMVWQLVA